MEFNLDHYWLLTSTTYGTWLPGDARGFVSPVPELGGRSRRHNIPATPYDKDVPGFVNAARSALKGPPIYFSLEQARALLEQFQETAHHRHLSMLALSIMANHVHIVVGMRGDPDASDVLGDFKSYGSRSLNKQLPKPASGTWWTESGSKRPLSTEESIRNAINYVLNKQEFPLVVWSLDPSWIIRQ